MGSEEMAREGAKAQRVEGEGATRASDEELAKVVEAAMLAYEGQPDCGEWPIAKDEAIVVATAVRARVEAPLLAEIAEHRRHVGIIMSREADVKRELAAVKAERDKAVDERNQHIKREYTSWETEFRKVEAERDELKRSSELLAVVYKGEMDARKSAQSELAALRQRDAVPVDPDAWKTPLELMTDNEFRTEFRGHAYDFGIWQFYPNGHRSSIAYTAEDAARAAQWLASYAAAHGCPVAVSEKRDAVLDLLRVKGLVSHG